MAPRVIPVEPFDLVVFGATGDLAGRKLLPALFYRCAAGQLPAGARIVGVGRRALTTEAFRVRARAAVIEHVPEADRDDRARLHARQNRARPGGRGRPFDRTL